MSEEIALVCPNCHEPIRPADTFCEGCGHQLIQAIVPNTEDHDEIDRGTAAGVTDRGLHHRRNEDALHMAVVGSMVALVVCDGVSTCASPHLAAGAAAGTAGELLAEALQERQRTPERAWDPVAATAAAMARAQAAVLLVPWPQRSGLEAPSCTFVSALWDGETIAVGWAGDSRAYWIGAAAYLQLTTDDSWAQEQRDAGTGGAALDVGDARAHSITRWLGADAPEQPPQTASFSPMEPGRLVVCTDGLWDYLPTTSALVEQVHSLPAEAAPIDVARALVRYAIVAGGHDNVTVAVADLTPGSRGRL